MTTTPTAAPAPARIIIIPESRLLWRLTAYGYDQIARHLIVAWRLDKDIHGSTTPQPITTEKETPIKQEPERFLAYAIETPDGRVYEHTESAGYETTYLPYENVDAFRDAMRDRAAEIRRELAFMAVDEAKRKESAQ